MFDNIYRNKKVIITGDTGFKGSWLAIWLLSMGADVVGISLPPQTPRDNYVICGLSKKITHIDRDIRDYDALRKIFNEYNPEIVFHLAAQAIVLEGYQNPLRTYSTNFMGTVNMLEAIRHTKSVKAGVLITTDKCYKNREWVHSYREIDRLGGNDPYSASKAACEMAIGSYTRSFFNDNGSANITSARAGNVIGGGDWGRNRILPDCVRALEKGEPIIIRNPNAVRPWQHVLEPLSGYLKLGSLLCTDSKKFTGPWNFGPSSKNMVTVKELAEKVIKNWGTGRIASQNKNNQFSEANLLHLDISKAVNKLKWQPKLDIDDTVNYTIDEYRTTGMTKKNIYEQRIEHILRYMDI